MYGKDCMNGWVREQETSLAIEHKLKETSEELGETCVSLETKKHVVSYTPAVQTFLEVFTEGRQGDRQK
jgi:hypothetical protein